ncbi:DUF3105 domain-containing protein [Euzebya pacifica]|uniref:DUF3105 domain-containing protein n=1 Tax=Euzebya pacifica TaxID=1608957 RepID=UPI0030F64B1E
MTDPHPDMPDSPEATDSQYDGLTKRQRQKARRQRRLAQDRVEDRRRRRRTAVRNGALALAGVVAAGVLITNAVSYFQPVEDPDGTVDVAVGEPSHVEGEVDYETAPAAGGPHASVWQNCGNYDEPVDEENAVHSLEHGAVWLAYDPDLPEGEVERLRDRAGGHVLVSPYEEPLDAPIVATAWGKQLAVETADDPAIETFIRAFEQGPQTPEPGAVCTRGIGEPA